MNLKILVLLCLAACAAAAPNSADIEEVGNLNPFPFFHPHLPPWFHHRPTTKKPTTTTEEPTTTTEIPTTTTEKLTTTKPHKTTTTTVKPTTTKPHKTTTTVKPHKTTTTKPTTELPLYRGTYERLEYFGYYKIYNEYSSWSNAWQTCQNEGAYLLILRSQEEYDALRYWKPNYEVPGYSYYGAHHKYINHEFITLFNEPLAKSGYNKWSRDFSNKTQYNNQDYPDMVVNLHPAAGIDDGLLLVFPRGSYFFVCKQDI